MKKLFGVLFVVIAVLALAYSAIAASTTATFGDRNSSNVYRVVADSDGTVTFASDTSIKYPYKVVATSATTTALEATDSGKMILDNSTYGGKFTLPTAAVGMRYSFSVGKKTATITVDTYDTNDTILFSISGTALDAGDSIKSTTQAGDAVTLFCPVANYWVIESMKASWTDNSTN